MFGINEIFKIKLISSTYKHQVELKLINTSSLCVFTYSLTLICPHSALVYYWTCPRVPCFLTVIEGMYAIWTNEKKTFPSLTFSTQASLKPFINWVLLFSHFLSLNSLTSYFRRSSGRSKWSLVTWCTLTPWSPSASSRPVTSSSATQRYVTGRL